MIIPLKFRQFTSPSSRDLAEGIQMVIIFMDADSHFAVVEVYLAKGNVEMLTSLTIFEITVIMVSLHL
jgi:hypothetical protein